MGRRIGESSRRRVHPLHSLASKTQRLRRLKERTASQSPMNIDLIEQSSNLKPVDTLQVNEDSRNDLQSVDDIVVQSVSSKSESHQDQITEEILPPLLTEFHEELGDGDANTMMKVREKVSYGGRVLKVECANHAVRRYGRALEKLIRSSIRFSGANGIKAEKFSRAVCQD
ncbi:uncharacterized protein LOC118185503 [Stegodyphus dumicola]|uniref:uncharacterized protein LOC118185503 n=1 Tax=Stegodyphus dumicola TaxID=202533 RepID=UPI0015B0EECA|nr:uncharacterized protein LOC118185503 [Stegodyphus dumicola]